MEMALQIPTILNIRIPRFNLLTILDLQLQSITTEIILVLVITDFNWPSKRHPTLSSMAKSTNYTRRLTHQPLPIEVLIRIEMKDIFEAQYLPL